MNIIEMTLASDVKPNDKVPGTFVTITRKLFSEYIDVRILTGDGEKKHFVNADCDEDIYSMAECIQFHMDGCKSTKSMIYDYKRILDYFTV